MASAKATIDHDEIRQWVEERGGFPAHVKRTGEDDDPGVLRIDYPGYSGTDTLERISWGDWFNWFDRDKLAFLYQAEGESRFSKLVARDSVEVSSSKRKSSSRSRKSSQPSVAERLTHAVKDVVAAVEQIATRRGSSKKSSSRKAASRKSSSRKSTPRKSGGRKAVSRKSASRKAVSRQSPARKSAGRKAASRKPASGKRSSKKRSSKKR